MASPETDPPAEDDYEFAKMQGPGRRYHKLAADLDRAYACCRLTGYERRVLQFVREHTWGVSAVKKSDPVPCEVNPTDLGILWRCHRQRVSEALNDLVEDGLILKVEGRYEIGKDARTWKNARITPSDLAYAIKGDKVDRTENRSAGTERKSVNFRTEIRRKTGFARR